MSKRNKNKGSNPPRTASPTPAPTPLVGPAETALPKLEEAARQHATPADLEAVATAAERPADASADQLVQRAAGVLALLEAQRKRLEEREAELSRRATANEKADEEVEKKRADLNSRGEALTANEKSFADRQQALVEREAELLSRDEAVRRRELDADAGFLARNRTALEALEREGATRREQIDRDRKQFEEERISFENEAREQRKQQQESAKAELAELREAARQEQEKNAAEAKRLRDLSAQLQLDLDLLTEDRKHLDAKVDQRAAGEIERLNGQLRAREEQLKAARAGRDLLEQQLAERNEADRRFGGETPDEVLNRLRQLEQANQNLRQQLGARPSAAASQRLGELERQKEFWDSDRLRLESEVAELRQEAARRRIAVTELESLRDEKRSLEAARALLRETNDQLRAEIGQLVEGAGKKLPFPSCTQMDTDDHLNANQDADDTPPSLREFATAVRHRMAWNPETEKELYYSEEDVRSFLGGLAMSRLHLLQGISGTGKTSLPLAFAEAIGAKAALIEVQAGWRDRQDLIGHFNSFEKRFHESEFLQAIYRASTPRHRDKPFLIVLDEMNLSHPEQYFADLLSALEQDPQHQRLVLMTATAEPFPRGFTEGGTKLPIPRNVWFIGTANHDETTKDFADKTYDRAHVMELPRHRQEFTRKDHPLKKPVSLRALQKAFDDACTEHDGEADEAKDFLQGKLAGLLNQRFRLGWGNRLERQMRVYVPVVVAAGGTVGEATDHILATKLLRKIRDRHDNRPEDLLQLRDVIQSEWRDLDGARPPRRSLDLLHDELRRLGHDEA